LEKLKNLKSDRAPYLSLELIMYVIKSQIHLVRQPFKQSLGQWEAKMSFKKCAKQELEKFHSMAYNPTEAPPRQSLRTHMVIFKNWRVFHFINHSKKNSTHVVQCTGESLGDEK
jgi:hypothetical protein